MDAGEGDMRCIPRKSLGRNDVTPISTLGFRRFGNYAARWLQVLTWRA